MIFIGIVLNLWINSGKIDIFIILFLTVHEHYTFYFF